MWFTVHKGITGGLQTFTTHGLQTVTIIGLQADTTGDLQTDENEHVAEIDAGDRNKHVFYCI